MKEEFENIDKFYKDNLVGYSEKAEESVWRNMRWTLFWMRYRWIFGIGIIGLLIGVGTVLYIGDYNYIDYYAFKNSILGADNNRTEIVLATYPDKEEISQKFGDEITSNLEGKVQQSKNKSISNPEVDEIVGSLLSGPDVAMVKVTGSRSDQYSNETVTVTVENSMDGFTDENSSIFNYHPFQSGIKSKVYSDDLVNYPDSNTIGYNRRVDYTLPSQRKYHFSASVYAGLSFSQSDLSGYDNEYLSFRNNNELDKPGWSLGVDLMFHIKNWIITSGINYAVYNQSRSYNYTYQEYSPNDSYFQYDTTWVWIFDSPNYGTPMMIDVDSSWMKVYDNISVNNSGQNQLKYIEIPIMLGYSINSNMFSFDINAGVSAGFLIYYEMKVPDFKNPDNIVSLNQMNKTVINFIADVSMHYHINHRISLFVSPFYKRNLVSIFNEDYPVNQKFSTTGVNLGINFSF